MDYSYNTKMVCSQQINFHIEGNVITNVSFIGGCNGNLKAISKLVDGMTEGQPLRQETDFLRGSACYCCP